MPAERIFDDRSQQLESSTDAAGQLSHGVVYLLGGREVNPVCIYASSLDLERIKCLFRKQGDMEFRISFQEACGELYGGTFLGWTKARPLQCPTKT